MQETPLAPQGWNPWKVIAIGLVGVFATALITGVVVARYAGGSKAEPPMAAEVGSPAQSGAAPQPEPANPQANAQPETPPPPAERAPRPSQADVAECNRYARAASGNKAAETLKDGLLGGAFGAGLGAAGGAIAGGGGGAGRGAGIGGLVGAAAGTLYGLSEGNRNASAPAAYRACMRRRG